MKTKVIVLIGESGSGKSHIAKHLEEEYGIPKIKSRTTREKRDDNDNDYFFVTEEEFDGYMEEWKMCSTEFGGARYTSLYSDIREPVMSHILDENGLKDIRAFGDGSLDIFAVRVFMDESKRITLVGKERMLRDEGRFTMGEESFDYFLDTSSFQDNPRKIAKMLIRMYQHFE